MTFLFFSAHDGQNSVRESPLKPVLRSEFDLPKHNVFEDRHAENLAIVSNVKQQEFNAESQETAIQFLVAPEATVTKLSVHFKLRKFGKLLDAIVENCGKEVVALKLVDFTADEDKRKHNLDKFGHFIRKLNEQFPNLQELVIEHHNNTKDCSYWENIVQVISSLKYVAFNGLSPQMLVKFIEKNPQIMSLGLSNDFVRRCCTNGFCTHAVQANDKLPANCLELFDVALPELKHLYLDMGLVRKTEHLERSSKVYLKKLKTFVCEKYDEGWQPNLQLIAGEELQYLEYNYVIDGSSWFQEEMKSDVESIAKKMTHFTNLKELTINAFYEIGGHSFNGPGFLSYLMSIWCSEELRNFILTKPHLNKIIIRKRAVFAGICHIFNKRDGFESKLWIGQFLKLIEQDIGGCKWNIRVDQHTFDIELFKEDAQ